VWFWTLEGLEVGLAWFGQDYLLMRGADRSCLEAFWENTCEVWIDPVSFVLHWL
jgi:hypothetical protein